MLEKLFSKQSCMLTAAGGCVVVVVLTVVFCHAVISFTFGMSNLVFWVLTCCQCPFPCLQYKGTARLQSKIEKNVEISAKGS